MRREAPLSAPAPLTAAHDLNHFSCGQTLLDNWLHRHARHSEGRSARTYVVCHDDVTVGYYSLAAGGLERGGMPKKLQRNVPDTVPVILLGRVAVDRQWQGRGLGADLLLDAFRRTIAASNIIGIRALLVHAIDYNAVAFYRSRAEFIEFPTYSRTLFLPAETIESAL